MYYWVNQGKTYKEEKEGGYLWAPTLNSFGKSFFHWENMKKLKPSDIVFNHRKGFLVGYCIIESESYLASQPEEFNVDVKWEKEGYMVDATYYMFSKLLDVDTIYQKIEHLLPSKYSPLNRSGEIPKTKANQGYLYELNRNIAEIISSIAEISYELDDKNLYKIGEDETNYKVPDKTTRKGLVTSRVGQGVYRRRILRRWKNKCAVNGASIKEILIASHIVSWKESTNKERLDVDNGILLSPTYDALFDRYLISFDNNGKIILSQSLTKIEFSKLGISGKEKIDNLTVGNKKYLKRHREKLIVL